MLYQVFIKDPLHENYQNPLQSDWGGIGIPDDGLAKDLPQRDALSRHPFSIAS
jgi:hypothetical protein